VIFRAVVLGALLISPPALADDAKMDAPKLRELINCFPAKNITEMVAKFQSLDADKRDTVDMLFEASFKVKDGGETAELCSEDPTREGTPHGEGLNFGISSDVHFLTNNGYHDLATLKDGLKDGKSHYKKMVPAAMRMLVPSLKYVMIEYEAEDTPPQFTAMKGQEPVTGLEHETFCELAMIKVKDLEKLGADGLKVMGGSYNLTPVPGVKTLKRFTECSKDEETEDDK